uniref:Uncharacterized protein n=1 Tax=Tetranychus urticae TaxID=32264 RepID=T1KXQ2_TETUR
MIHSKPNKPAVKFKRERKVLELKVSAKYQYLISLGTSSTYLHQFT